MDIFTHIHYFWAFAVISGSESKWSQKDLAVSFISFCKTLEKFDKNLLHILVFGDFDCSCMIHIISYLYTIKLIYHKASIS